MRSDEGLSQQPMTPPGPPADAIPISYPVTIWIVAFVAFVNWFFPVAMMQLLLAAGFGPHLTGPPTPEQMEPLTRLNLLYAGGLAFPLQIASVVFLLPRFAGIRLDQIGLTWRRFGRNCLWGVVGWLILTPVCMALYFAVLRLYGSQAAANVHEHPLVLLAHHGLTLGELLLLIAAVTVTAPVMEEMLFRGALQTWLENRPEAAHFVMFLAVLASLPVQWDAWVKAWREGGWVLLLHCAPILLVVALTLIYLVVYRLSRTPARPALFAASTLFAAVHSFAWPSPVPLFLLALGLGWLAQRTRSLAGPIVLHGLFNAVNCALLFWQ
jgi:membrane protease YdiL (CAAX protease family)